MPFRFRSWILVLAAASVLAAGCRGTSPGAAGGRDGRSSAKVSSSPPASRAAETARIEAHAHYAAGVIHGMRNEPELALKEYQAAALQDPGNESLVLEVSRLLLQAKQPEQALELLLRATAQPTASGLLFARLGFIYSQLGKPDLAIQASRAAIQKQGRSLAGYQNLFVNYLQNKQVSEAEDALDEAARVSDPEPEFLIGLAELYLNLGLQVPARKESTSPKALRLLERAEKFPNLEVPVRLRLADAFNLLGKEDYAARIYAGLLQPLADRPQLRENVRAKLADIYLRMRDRSKAAEQLEAIIRDNPTDAQAYYLLGSIAYDSTNHTGAAEYFTRTLLLEPDFERAYYDLAGAQLSLDKPADALATLDRARQKFRQNFVLEYFSGVAASRQKDYTNALKYFTSAEIVGRAQDTNRLNHLFYFEFGATCERAGNFAEAEKYLEKCLELAPDFADAQNYLGYMWADRGEKLDRALELIEKAVKAEPENAAFLDSMGWVLFRLNRPREALDYLLKAVQLSENEEGDAEVYDHLGDVHAALGQHDDARAAWRRSLELDKNDEVRKKLER